jgi:hypothetical protein
MRYTLGFDKEKLKYFIFLKDKIYLKCDVCDKDIILCDPVVIHTNDKGLDSYWCMDCYHKRHILGKCDIYILAYLTDVITINFKVVKSLDPIIAGGSVTVWETEKLEGRKIDKTIYGNTIPSLEGANIGAEITDGWRDKELTSPKQVDKFFIDLGQPIKPGYKSAQDQLDTLEWERNHSNAPTGQLDNKKQEVLK